MTKIYGQSSVVFSEDHLTREIESLRAELEKVRAERDARHRWFEETRADYKAVAEDNDTLREQVKMLQEALLLAESLVSGEYKMQVPTYVRHVSFTFDSDDVAKIHEALAATAPKGRVVKVFKSSRFPEELSALRLEDEE